MEETKNNVNVGANNNSPAPETGDQPTPQKEPESFTDPLLECLVILTKINGNPFSANALTAGLPLVQHRLTPQLFIKAAERAGFAARIVQRPLKKISKLILPAILVLKDNRACILSKILDKNNVEIILPDSNGGTSTISLDDLKTDYSSFAIFLKPFYKFDERADEYKLATKKSWFWGTLWSYRKIYGQVFIAAFLINLFALASPVFIMNVYDRVVPNFAVETLWVLAIGVGIVIGFDLLLRTLRGFLIDIAGKKADIILASTLFQQAMNVKMAAKPASSGAFANNLREFEVLRDFFTSATVTSLVDLPFIFLYLTIIWLIGGAVAIVPLLAVPIIFSAAYFFEIPIRRAVEQASFSATQKHAILVEAVNGLETIKSLSAEGVLQRKWEQFVGVSAKAALKSRFFSTLAINFTACASQLITIIMVIVGVYAIAAHHLTTGGLIACVILNGRTIAPLAQIAGILTRFNQSKVALKNLNKVMELPVERSAETKFLHRPMFQESIEFHNVSFQYPNQETYALRGINFKINMGEKVAIIGPMGSGKSTIEKLILSLYSPTEGAVFIDGVDITQIDPADLRRNMGYVSQDYSLLYGTVQSNISLSMPWANDQLILQAAKLANVDHFVSQHPAGYAMPIGEYGSGLSGGQRQSIAIARAILSNPPILLLDEPTSSIDLAAEQTIIKNLSQFATKKTLLLITHKMPLLALVDRVIVMTEGKIIADGPKQEVFASIQNNAPKQENAHA